MLDDPCRKMLRKMLPKPLTTTAATTVLPWRHFTSYSTKREPASGEVDAEACEKLLSEGWTLLDVRESDEWEQGSIPDSVHMPRGLLEMIVESRFPDRGTPLVAMCASGARSALAAATLAEMGYNRVVSMDGGFDRWKTEGHRWRRQRTLTPEQRKRYDRHLKLAEVGEAGQLKLLDAKILLIGVGGLGSPAALYLAAAGVGTLGIVDMDRVDESNLQRQVLHDTHSIGQLKVDSAEKALTALNPDIRIIAHSVRLDTANVLDILDGYDMIVDGTDNFPARYLLNDASVKLGIPVVHGIGAAFRRACHGFRPAHRAHLQRRLPRTACRRAGPSPCTQLCRVGRAGSPARDHRRDAGIGGDQADPRHRQPAGRTPDC